MGGSPTRHAAAAAAASSPNDERVPDYRRGASPAQQGSKPPTPSSLTRGETEWSSTGVRRCWSAGEIPSRRARRRGRKGRSEDGSGWGRRVR